MAAACRRRRAARAVNRSTLPFPLMARRDPVARLVSFILAALITIPIADSLYRIPIQVSDSLEAIVIATKYHSTRQLLEDSLKFSPTTFRPMRYLQTRWLLQAVNATGFTYNAVFRMVHVALMILLVILFLIAVRVRDWIDLIQSKVALTPFKTFSRQIETRGPGACFGCADGEAAGVSESIE